ncbi:MAG: hypothetical protein Q7V31_09145 [Parvibaculum sp.]|uniref:OsmC family protein n=1 Tax=Parvibaculum sp. TaxID=2024848 RepID=UPI00271FE137|nr:hypothetical protein [Parvibaculum sp.]MDO8839084.1 hypothetical protein [Parvibaculum sp.]
MLEYSVQARRIDDHGSLAVTKHAEIALDTDVKGREDAFNPAELFLASVAACMIKGIAADGVTVDGVGQRIALLASVPLSSEPWVALGEGEVVAVSEGQLVARCPAASDLPAPDGA